MLEVAEIYFFTSKIKTKSKLYGLVFCKIAFQFQKGNIFIYLFIFIETTLYYLSSIYN